MMDKDFPRVEFKVNTSGSWANLAVIHAGLYDEVKAACVIIAKASFQKIKFKALNADGGVIEVYDTTPQDGISKWHEPRLPHGSF
ncbi:MAG: hypothetical protein WC073_10990 [Sterolibacterium sp.]